MKYQVLRKSISGRVLPGLPPQKLTAIFGVPSRPVTRPEMYHYTLPIVPTVLIVLILPFLFILGLLTTHNTNVSALSYQSNTGVEFTINPTITISITGDHNGNLVINNLTPSNASDSNIITITTSSNAIAGYGLYSTVGSDSSSNVNGTSTGNPSTELRRNGTDTTNKFTSITTNKSSLSDFNGSDWGYSYSTDSGTTWISGDITSTTATGYNGLPLYTTESPIKLINTTTSGSSSVQFKIGAKASNSQIAGDYTNTINFIGVAKPNPVIPTYIQDLTLAQCQKNVGINGNPSNVGDELTVVDKRDNNTYTVRYINGACWMTQNLAIAQGSLLTNELSNTDSNGYIIPTTDLTYGNTYFKGESHAGTPGKTGTGYWYNYCAASAGTVCNSSVSQDTPYDVCPAGWRLPTYSEQSGITDYKDAYSPIIGGYYNGGSIIYPDYGAWWSATADGSTKNQRRLRYNGSDFDTNYGSRVNGYYIRCVRTS